MVSLEQKFWLEFFELYKSLPAVWKIKSDEYKDRNKKTKAYRILTNKCKEIERNADRNFVIRKINTFRSSYRKEQKKVEQGWKSGTEYKPSLWYFDCLSFLKNQEFEIDTINERFDDDNISKTMPMNKSHENLFNSINAPNSNIANFKMLSSDNRHFWSKFFELYESLPALWKIKSDEYKDRNKKAMAYKVLIEKCKEIEPDADREFVIRKIYIFRRSYRKELKKIKQKLMAGKDYKPSLWYFNRLSFLENQMKPLCNNNIDAENRRHKDTSTAPGENKFYLGKPNNASEIWCNNSRNDFWEDGTSSEIVPAEMEFCQQSEENHLEVEAENHQNDDSTNFKMMSYARKFWSQFLELYKSLPAVWKIKSDEYKDRNKKAMAYNVLIEKCKKVEPNADREYVIRKINSFRSTYRKELKKIEQQLMIGNDYKPSLWFFDHLSFLQNQDDALDMWCNGVDSENSYCGDTNSTEIITTGIKLGMQKPEESLEILRNRNYSSDEFFEDDNCIIEVKEENCWQESPKAILKTRSNATDSGSEETGDDDSQEDQPEVLRAEVESANEKDDDKTIFKITSNGRKFWSEFFDLYKSLPAVWKTKSYEYKDRSKKAMAYNVLIEKCKEIEPHADREFVVRNINNFQSSYRKELKKIEQQLMVGKKYRPSLWYFDRLSFLKNQDDTLEMCYNGTDSDSVDTNSTETMPNEMNLWQQKQKDPLGVLQKDDDFENEFTLNITNKEKTLLESSSAIVSECEKTEDSDGQEDLLEVLCNKVESESEQDDYKTVFKTRSYEKTFWSQFFELYKSLPAVWKIKCDEYKDRNKKDMAYKILIKKCKEIEPNADRRFVIRKINSFRSSYRKEMKKVEQLLMAGKEYKPSLWYFDQLSFLTNQDDISQMLYNGTDSENSQCRNTNSTEAMSNKMNFGMQKQKVPIQVLCDKNDFENELSITKTYEGKCWQQSHKAQLEISNAINLESEKTEDNESQEDLLEVLCCNVDSVNEEDDDQIIFKTASCGRKFWSQFLDLYKSLPAVWKVKSEEYKDRDKKAMAYKVLIEKCKEIEPNADREFVVRKINNFRCSYRKELKKVEQQLMAGKDYKSCLWYFDCLSFLENQDHQSLEHSEGTNVQKPFDRSDRQAHSSSSSMKKKKHRSVNPDELLELATKRLKRCDDYSQTLANVWASEFRLASEEQQFFAKKAIDDILFEARLGTLHRNSVKINENFSNDYAEFPPAQPKRESCQSPRSNHDSITIERIGIESHDHDDLV